MTTISSQKSDWLITKRVREITLSMLILFSGAFANLTSWSNDHSYAYFVLCVATSLVMISYSGWIIYRRWETLPARPLRMLRATALEIGAAGVGIFWLTAFGAMLYLRADILESLRLFSEASVQ